MSQRLGDLLVKEKVITPEQLEQATKLQKEAHLRLASALVKLGFLSDEDSHQFPVAPVRRARYQSLLLRNRSRSRQADPVRNHELITYCA